YKSALGRAWNTRYHGDPASIDCATTPTGPSAGTCGLIGAPCKDYDVESPLKLHGRYVGGAKWTTAIDDPGGTHADDLFFRFNVPFSGAILSEGGLWVRAGAAFTFPDWLPAPDALSNGGARVDVAFNGMKSAQGSLYVKPFDYLSFGLCQASTTACTTHADCSDPLFGIDELTYCRDDGFCTLGPCLGRLTLSGYGPNGVDDGIDDGFYARVNLLAKPLPTLTAGARASLETLFEPRRDLAFASYDLSCPPGQTCQSAADYRLALATGLQLELPLPLAFDAAGNPTEFIRICGNAATQKPGLGDATADWVLAASDLCPKDGDVPSFGTFIDGDIEVLDQTFSGSALLNSCGFRARSALELGKVEIGDFRLPSLASVNADIMGRFAPFRVCAAGYSEINLALPDGLPATLLEIDSKVTADVCIGEATKYPTRDSGQFLRLLTGTPDGTPHTAHAEFFSLEGGPKLFEVNGSFDLCVGDGDRIGQPGVLTCADNHIKLCGDLNLLDGAIHVENRCFEIRVPHFDLTYSFHEAVELNL
ncbi:MAG: hypothetical protein IV100_34605, partial [Myxococcales bacterium]|nr:hypothetical protein [Myxococcales bacterium]